MSRLQVVWFAEWCTEKRNGSQLGTMVLWEQGRMPSNLNHGVLLLISNFKCLYESVVRSSISYYQHVARYLFLQEFLELSKRKFIHGIQTTCNIALLREKQISQCHLKKMRPHHNLWTSNSSQPRLLMKSAPPYTCSVRIFECLQNTLSFGEHFEDSNCVTKYTLLVEAGLSEYKRTLRGKFSRPFWRWFAKAYSLCQHFSDNLHLGARQNLTEPMNQKGIRAKDYQWAKKA